MKAHFLSNLHNHLNLTLWGIILIVISSPIQIITFNLVDTIYRGMNAIFQSIIEPIFKHPRARGSRGVTFNFLSTTFLNESSTSKNLKKNRNKFKFKKKKLN